MIRTHWTRNLAVFRAARSSFLRHSSSVVDETHIAAVTESEVLKTQVEDDAQDLSTPWYLRNDIKSTLLEEKEIEIPDIPSGAPAHVEQFLTLLAKDYGMEELSLFDMTKLDDSHEFRSNNNSVDYILVGTGKSERHNFKAAAELRNHIKHTYNVIPLVEGMVANGKTPAQRRRLLRQARKGPSATDNDYGKSANSWVLFHHENVDVHLMTAQRRQELNLESLWCSPEDLPKYEQQQLGSATSDHIFSGIRRFHTRVSRRSASSAKTCSYLQELNEMPLNSSPQDFALLKSRFISDFQPHDAADFDTKIQILKTLHCLDPQLVPLVEVENTFYKKHTQLKLGAVQKSNDVTEYLKLLIDTPVMDQSSVSAADSRFASVSMFISNLYRFSTDKFSMTANPQFIPLLWRLTYSASNTNITPKLVADIIDQNIPADFSKQESAEITFSTNSARNVLTLIEHHNSESAPGEQVSADFKELVMFTYGSAGKWKRFWDTWESIHFPDAPGLSEALNKWVRLAVFLALTSNKTQALHFLNSYWKNSTSVGGSFLEALQANNGFNSDAEKQALISAMFHMVSLFESDAKLAFDGIKTTLHSLQ